MQPINRAEFLQQHPNIDLKDLDEYERLLSLMFGVGLSDEEEAYRQGLYRKLYGDQHIAELVKELNKFIEIGSGEMCGDWNPSLIQPTNDPHVFMYDDMWVITIKHKDE